MKIMFSSAVKNKYPDLKIALLNIENIKNEYINKNIEIESENLVKNLVERYSNYTRQDLLKDSVIEGYYSYYKYFNKTYHVLLQLESIVFKGRKIQSSTPIVHAMFMAELKNRYLTAAHDLSNIYEPILIDIANGNEDYKLIGNSVKTLLPSDIYIKDTKGIISSIIYGPDERTKITNDTKNALFAIYAPAVTKDELLINHLDDIANYLRKNNNSIIINEKLVLQAE